MEQRNIVLAFDTANEVIAIGVGELDEASRTVHPLAHEEVAAHRASNTQLVPRIDALLAREGIARGRIACVACGRGPGSFTGVRICMATAKGIASALDVPLWGVSSLDAIAWQLQAAGVRGAAAVAADAMRKEVYPVRYELSDEGVARQNEDCVLKAADAAAYLAKVLAGAAGVGAAGVADRAGAADDANVAGATSVDFPSAPNTAATIAGDALHKYADLFEPLGSFAEENLWTPTGEGLLLAFQAAWRTAGFDALDAQAGNPAFALPVYTRLSDAEENERIRLAKNDPKNLTTGVQESEAGLRADQRRKYEDRYGDTWGKDFESQVHRTTAVANLMRVNVLKRMESSVNSFRITLRRILDGCVDLRARLDADASGVAYGTEGLEDGFDDDDAEEFEAGGKVRVDLRDVDALRLGQDLDFDIQVLRALLTYADAVTPERDAKLVKLRDFIAGKVSEPYNPGNRKVLVFSAFADTTAYLFEQLAPWLKRELGIECAEVAGSSNRTYSLKLPRTTFENILARFSPVSKELPESQRELGEIDVVFATDCISEGQNLQDCDCLVNYDIHWNPVRIIQRFGRIDRLGSKNSQIQLVNFWPDIALDEYIQLEGRVKGRMALLDASATGEENVLEAKGNGEMNDLKYRRRQLQQLKSEVLDLEDISGGISITDFAFDDFRVELQRYAKEHPGALENSPAGLHAVAPIPDELRSDVKPGVVFCLKQNDEGNDPRDTNPVFPYYVVYVSADGEVMTKHTQPKPALDIMRAVCSGHPEPIAKLCREFNRETRDGTRMDAYTDLLDDVVAAITGTQQDKGIESLFSLGEVGSGTVMGFNDYSMLCFAVLR